MRKAIAVAAVVAAVAGTAAAEDMSARASEARSERAPVAVYRLKASSHPVDVAAIRVTGRGCMASEDSLVLRLVDFHERPDGRWVATYKCLER